MKQSKRSLQIPYIRRDIINHLKDDSDFSSLKRNPNQYQSNIEKIAQKAAEKLNEIAESKQSKTSLFSIIPELNKEEQNQIKSALQEISDELFSSEESVHLGEGFCNSILSMKEFPSEKKFLENEERQNVSRHRIRTFWLEGVKLTFRFTLFNILMTLFLFPCKFLVDWIIRINQPQNSYLPDPSIPSNPLVISIVVGIVALFTILPFAIRIAAGITGFVPEKK